MKSRMLCAATLAALLPLSVIAADNDQYGKDKDKSMMPDESFKKLDTNGDGRISQAEAAADSSIVFSSADANGDGYLDSSEWKASTKGHTNPSTPQSSPTTPETTSPTEPDTTPPSTSSPPDTETPRQ